jgi:hypothetical protein
MSAKKQVKPALEEEEEVAVVHEVGGSPPHKFRALDPKTAAVLGTWGKAVAAKLALKNIPNGEPGFFATRQYQTMERVSGGEALVNELLRTSREVDRRLALGLSKVDTEIDPKTGVAHLGSGVFVQACSRGVTEPKQSVILTRFETRDVACDLLECLTSGKAKTDNLVLTGNPGVGKSLGTLPRTLCELLKCRAAVLVVARKDDISTLYLPKGETEWEVKDKSGIASELMRIPELVVLYDPRELAENLTLKPSCRSVLFASTNEEKHFQNFSKDGKILYTSVWTAAELEAGASLLYMSGRSPENCEAREEGRIVPLSIEEKRELHARTVLVGPLPRYVFAFAKAFKERHQAINVAVKKFGLQAVVDIIKDPATTVTQATVSGTIFTVFVQSGRGWFRRSDRDETDLMVTGSATLALIAALENAVENLKLELTGDAFGRYFEMLVGILLRRVRLNVDDVDKVRVSLLPALRKEIKPPKASVFAAINLLPTDQSEMVIPPQENFPAIDFALSPTCWVNIKGGNKTGEIGVNPAEKLLRKLGVLDGTKSNTEFRGDIVIIEYVAKDKVPPTSDLLGSLLKVHHMPWGDLKQLEQDKLEEAKRECELE